MAILVTGNTFSNGDQVTAAKLNASVNSATFHAGAVDGSTTQLSSGSIIVKDGGIIPAKLSTGGPSWVSGGLNSLGDLSLTNANPEILGGDTDGVMYVAPSTTKDLGGNILLYGDTHASKAKDIEIRATTGVEAHYDDSASKWDFQANAISTSGVLTAVGTSLTGTAAGLTSGNVTTNANLTGHVTSVGNAAVLGSFTSAQLKTALTNETGSGAAVFGTSPTLVTPALGTPSALVATNATGTAAGLIVGATTGVEAGADVTDTANVTAAGALMDSELTDLAGVKGVTISTLQAKPSEGAFADGDKTKLDAIEASADVTDTTNVTSAGALMDSELTSIGSVKALNQGVTTTGTPTFAKVTATTGVLFGTDTAAVNTLDDYEEGTWTPVLRIGGATTGISYGAAVGSYTKIGNLVNASFYVLLSSKGSATGTVSISVPFASADTTNGFASAHVGSILACTWADYPAGYLSKNSSAISFKQYTEAGGASGISNSNLTDTSSFIMSITYRV